MRGARVPYLPHACAFNNAPLGGRVVESSNHTMDRSSSCVVVPIVLHSNTGPMVHVLMLVPSTRPIVLRIVASKITLQNDRLKIDGRRGTNKVPYVSHRPVRQSKGKLRLNGGPIGASAPPHTRVSGTSASVRCKPVMPPSDGPYAFRGTDYGGPMSPYGSPLATEDCAATSAQIHTYA